MKWIGVPASPSAAPFWETKAPAEWTEQRASAPVDRFTMGADAGSARKGRRTPRCKSIWPPPHPWNKPSVNATAAIGASASTSRSDPLAEEYRVWFEDNRATQIVLAVGIANNPAFADGKDTSRMENECVMRVGRKKYKLTGFFPPSPGDRYLRLAFPREVQAGDKNVSFDLYLPGVALPFRSVQFTVKEMILKGKLEM